MTIDELKSLSHHHPILFYDGVCHLCNGFVNTVIEQDDQGLIKFCTLQDEAGQQVSEALSIPHALDTTIGMKDGKIYTHSDVLKMVIDTLGGKWLILKPLYVFPKGFRDMIYNWVARNRYRWFGEKDQCMIPTPDIRERFLDI